MKSKRSRLMAITCLMGLLAGSVPSFAQDTPPKKLGAKPDLKRVPSPAKPDPRGKPVKTAADGTFKFLGSKFSLGKLVKGAPYSATAITESTQTLSDGNQIVRKNEATIYRDSEGRTRIDQKLETIGKWSSDGEPRLMIFINDPVAGVSYSLDPGTRTAHRNVYTLKKPLPPGSSTINGKVATQADLEEMMEKKRRLQEAAALLRNEATKEVELKKDLEMTASAKMDPNQKRTESLGTQTIEGVTAEGTRSTITIPAGDIGNSRPIEIVDETWYSPELKVPLLTKHHDPRTGDVVYRLTNLIRGEPDRSLFEVPPGYAVNEGSSPTPRKMPEGQLE